ncbi:MAG TPA: CRISPR-associated protein Csm5 [Sedimenticola sp.]|nr:CRISPR-associated protein Csm5 [Sedimenticola sp.]
MSGMLETRELWITPLSPVHMGTDEDYTPTGYVIEGNALFEFDHRALANLPPAEKQRLAKILSGRASEGMLKQVQAFFHGNQEWLIPAAVNLVRTSDELGALYQARVGRAAQVEKGGHEVHNRLEIERASYNPIDRRLMLPGTGLKGAIRTALLDDLNQGSSLREMEYFDRRGKRNRQPRNNREMQESIFKGSFATDPMRLVQVSDCAWQGASDLGGAEILFAVNRKKRPVQKGGTLVQSQAERQGLYQLLECATPFRVRAFRGSLGIANPAGKGISADRLPKFRFGFAEVAAACNRFYRPIFDAETALLRSRGYLDGEWRERVRSLLDDPEMAKRMADNRAFLLRAGRHSGAESVTLNGVRSIRIIKGKGEKAGYESESKTLWLAASDRNEQHHLRPFGWLLVEMGQANREPPAWPREEDLRRESAGDQRQWLQRARERQETLRRKVAALREAAETEARAAAERAAEEARKQEVEARRLAGLSPVEREMEEIIERERRNNPGAVLLGLLEAGHWEKAEDAVRVAEEIRSLWVAEKRWIPSFSGTNKQKRKQKARCEKVLGYLGEEE